MSCPDHDRLLLEELGELPRNDSRSIDEHVAGCEACRARRVAAQHLLADVADAARAPSPGGEAFVRRVVVAARRAPAATSGHTVRRPWLLWPSLTLAAAALAVVPAALLMRDRPAPGGLQDSDAVPGTLAARGSGAGEHVRLRADVLLVRDGRLVRLAGQPLRESDAFVVKVTNGTDKPVHLIAFARDSAGEIHWLYPAYADPATDPRAPIVAAGAREQLMSEIVQPDSPAAGPLQFVTVMSAEPLTVKQVEARLRARSPGARSQVVFSGAVVQEWSAMWGKGQ